MAFRGQMLAAVLGLGLALHPAAAQETRRIVIATEGAFPPFNFVDQGNEPQGFEVDLGKALCEAMNAACTFVVHEWDGIVKSLLAGRFDAIMASMAITERRKYRIAFSKPYYRVPAAFIGPKGSDVGDVSPKALAGKTIGVAERSEHAAYLEDRYTDSDIRFYGKLDEATLDLLAQRLDLVLGDKLALSRFLATREGECCRFIADVPPDPAYHGEGVAIGLRKGDKELRERFDRALGKVIADGTYDRIRRKYFSFDIRPDWAPSN